MITFDAPVVASIITSVITVLIVGGGGLFLVWQAQQPSYNSRGQRKRPEV